MRVSGRKMYMQDAWETLTEDEVSEVLNNEDQYVPSGKKVVARLYNETQAGRLVSCVLKGTKSDDKIARKGYYFAHVTNLDYPMFSELGDVFVDFDEQGNPYRLM